MQLQNIEPRLIQLGYQIIAISPDLPIKLAKTIRKHKLDYLFLSDSKMKAARAFGIAFRVDEETGLTGAFALNPQEIVTDAIIKFEYINPNYTVRIKPDLLLAAAKAALA